MNYINCFTLIRHQDLCICRAIKKSKFLELKNQTINYYRTKLADYFRLLDCGILGCPLPVYLCSLNTNDNRLLA